MEPKTKVEAKDGQQELFITREFDLPLELLFQAYVEAEFLEQWMGTKVLKLESRKHGSYQFETTDPKGNRHGFHGVIHEFSPNEKITRTFEMENTPFCAQLEFLEFEKLTEATSRLRMHIVYRTTALRDQMVQFGMGPGVNMAHNRLQKVMSQVRKP